SGAGSYRSSAGYTPPSAGNYYWYVSYGGGGGNAASNSGCGAGMASTVVSPITVLGLGVAPHKFSIAGRRVHGKCVKPTKRNAGDKRCETPIKLTVGYTLNGADTVTFTVKRKSAGRKVN